MPRVAIRFGLLTAALLLAAGCAAKSEPGPATVPPGAGTSAGVSTDTAVASKCTPQTLQTHSSGALTVATDSPAYEPWFKDDKPSNGKGFESAVAYAVAKQLGYSPSKVNWVKASFNTVVSPAPKNYDFDINEVSITVRRAKVVDFSSGYYDVAQAVVALNSNKYAKATTVAGLKGAKLGAQQGTTSFDAINDVIKPGPTPAEYPSNDLAVQALKNGTIDGLVVDLPTGLYITAAQVPHSKIIGQLPVSGQPEQFGLVLDKGSSLTPCVTQAVDALRSDGTLKKLQQKWLTASAGAPVLK
ncbi:MAG TPA: ABC transporter substrate-binding protein [Jatrophihabitantaceae bacterium]|jgi:polar amino acid transport system substrate-binding protein|nr:ABC transporter substrate-binding protein [Jatrophihabitantaceae bacterium]